MLSGCYRTDQLTRHWSKSNPEGLCRLPGCSNEKGTLHHILLSCPALSEARKKSVSHWSAFLVPRPWLFPLVNQFTHGDERQFLQFLLDPSVLPLVISTSKCYNDALRDCFYLSRTWNFTIHLTREKLLQFWNIENLFLSVLLGLARLPSKKAGRLVL